MSIMTIKMVHKLPISVYVLTYNNLRTIERCLKSLGWAEELVIVDSFSTDGTFEVCQQYTDKAIRVAWKGHRDQYQCAADLTTGGWIMFVDADEEIPPELVEEIGQKFREGIGDVDGFFVYRRTYYLGQWIRYGGWYPDGEIRLYRRDKGRWEGGLHAKVEVDGKVVPLKSQYLHYTYRDISDQIRTIDRYSQIAAEDMAGRGEKFSVFKLFFHPPLRFIKEYLLKFGFRDGLPGIIVIVSTMFYVFMKYAKLWEIKNSNKSLPTSFFQREEIAAPKVTPPLGNGDKGGFNNGSNS